MRALDIFSGTQYSLPHFSPWPGSNVGERIRAARLRRRLTLRELAARVGVTPSTLSRLERDQFNPTLGALKVAAATLNITIGSLFAPSARLDRVVVRPSDRKRPSQREGALRTIS